MEFHFQKFSIMIKQSTECKTVYIVRRTERCPNQHLGVPSDIFMWSSHLYVFGKIWVGTYTEKLTLNYDIHVMLLLLLLLL
jgi:hypothetical protein